MKSTGNKSKYQLVELNQTKTSDRRSRETGLSRTSYSLCSAHGVLLCGNTEEGYVEPLTEALGLPCVPFGTFLL